MKKLIIANWKSNKNIETATTWLEEFQQLIDESGFDLKSHDFVIAPPMNLLGLLSKEISKGDLKLAVQDLSPYPAGSYTGAVSTANLKGMDVEYAIVGHSERRRHFGESHLDVANKVTQALDGGLVPVVCIDDEYLSQQAAALETDQLKKCVVAYEPLEAIGSGDFQPVDEVTEVVSKVKDVFGNVPVIYGGSVDAQNVADYLDCTDGVLVGGASLKAASFASLARACNE